MASTFLSAGQLWVSCDVLRVPEQCDEQSSHAPSSALKDTQLDGRFQVYGV